MRKGDTVSAELAELASQNVVSEKCSTAHFLIPEWGPYSAEEENDLRAMMANFNAEYTMRREVLSRRLDVTIQAFLRSDAAKKKLVLFCRTDCFFDNS